MSFKCTNCLTGQPTYTKPNKVVVETRIVSYPVTSSGKIPTGTETVKEINLCNGCM